MLLWYLYCIGKFDALILLKNWCRVMMTVVPCTFSLNRKVGVDIIGQLSQLGDTLKEYLTAGSLVLLRTVAKVLAYSVCARQAALLGSVSAAAYNLTFQLGFATTQIW